MEILFFVLPFSPHLLPQGRYGLFKKRPLCRNECVTYKQFSLSHPISLFSFLSSRWSWSSNNSNCCFFLFSQILVTNAHKPHFSLAWFPTDCTVFYVEANEMSFFSSSFTVFLFSRWASSSLLFFFPLSKVRKRCEGLDNVMLACFMRINPIFFSFFSFCLVLQCQ